ncbi:hypothetical protein E2562_014862 [Oryza meyeriana var. granulata]|uniref:Uncharacterized protein n=1 Tax=Oryza meyeriana var. granulata TaxID=110450 RepID=A0A6G1BW05_9ORYZ|nr:hypothetical protein E2562_014862 [Oryza meyeriana var. granulata]
MFCDPNEHHIAQRRSRRKQIPRQNVDAKAERASEARRNGGNARGRSASAHSPVPHFDAALLRRAAHTSASGRARATARSPLGSARVPASSAVASRSKWQIRHVSAGTGRAALD